jgi:hypothetical protein
MKNQVRILFAVVLCMFICQTNVKGQIFKKAPMRANESAAKVSPTEVSGKVSPTEVAGKVSPNNVAGKITVAGLPKNQPGTAVTIDKINDIRSYAGMPEAAFAAKMKSQGYEISKDDPGMRLSENAYYSKTTGYYISVEYGLRNSAKVVREVQKVKDMKNSELQAVKKAFLDYGKQCTDMKLKFKKGMVIDLLAESGVREATNTAEWISKCLPEMDRIINQKRYLGASQVYEDAGYTYTIYFQQSDNLTYLSIKIEDIKAYDPTH